MITVVLDMEKVVGLGMILCTFVFWFEEGGTVGG